MPTAIYQNREGSEDMNARRRRASRTRSDEFAENEYGDVVDPNPRSDEEYRDAAGRDYGAGGAMEYGTGDFWGGGGWGGGGDPMAGVSGFDRATADIPIIGDLFGSRGRIARAEAERERMRREAALGALAEFMPNANDLYNPEAYIGDTTPEGALARANWTEWAEGGFTDADRAMMDEGRRRAMMTARANREADLSALEARGMGGSGASLAASLAAGEGAADRGAAMDATMMGAAQQRQIGATDALGEFAEGETGYRRGREGRNVDRLTDARQQAHENRERHTSMSIGMNPYGGRDPNAEEDEGDAAAGGLLSFIGDLL